MGRPPAAILSSEEKRNGSFVEGRVGYEFSAGSLRAPSLLASVRTFTSEGGVGADPRSGLRQGGRKLRGPVAANKEPPPFCKAGPRAVAAAALRTAGWGEGG